MSNRESLLTFVERAHQELFTEHDLSSLERYYAPNFIEHSPFVADSISGLRDLVVESGPLLRYTMVRGFTDGEYVVMHGYFDGLDEEDNRLLGFDLYRVENDLIVEHWDNLQIPAEADGYNEYEGPTEIGAGDEAANKRLIESLYQTVMIGGNYDHFYTYLDEERLIQHIPHVEDGGEPFVKFLRSGAEKGQVRLYQKVHRTIAVGHFVLVQSEGAINNQRMAYCDLWRIEEGVLAELWSSAAEIPKDEEALHSHGIF